MVYLWDMHVHSKSFERPYLNMESLAKSANKSDLDGILLVDKVFVDKKESFKNTPAQKLKKMRQKFRRDVDERISVLEGYEIRTNEGDLIVIGEVNDLVEEYIKKNKIPKSISDWLEKVVDSDSASIIPHPFFPLSSVGSEVLQEKLGGYNGLETFNASSPVLFDPFPGVNRKARDFWEKKRLDYKISGTCGTDNCHGVIGKTCCMTDYEIHSESDLVKALQKGDFVPGTVTHAGRIFDNVRSTSTMIASIIKESLTKDT